MSIIPKLRKDFHKLSVLEQEKEKQRVKIETRALIEEMGQEDEKKALPTVRKYVAQIEQEEREQFYNDRELLTNLKGNRQNYQRALILILQRFVKLEGISNKWTLNAESTDKGIVLGIANTDYVSAFAVCGIPEYDIRACKTLAVKLGNTVARLEGNFRTTESGVIIATEEEAKIAISQFDKKDGRQRDS